jgi:DNA polymerase-3 subunit delta'
VVGHHVEVAGTLSTGVDLWGDVIGQDRAVRQLQAALAEPVHAYLFVGPAGSSKRAAARAFAGALLSAGSDGEAARRHVRLALDETHPDLRVVEPQGGRFRVEEAEALRRHAVRAPLEGNRKVVLGVHLDRLDGAEGMLLKVVEEPPESTIFILLAADVIPQLETIASRSAIVEFHAIPADVIAARLVEEGVGDENAHAAAAAALGDVDRARLLATDERLALRHELWRSVPERLDGRGTRVAELVAEVQAAIDDSLTALAARQEREVTELNERIERYGQRGSGKRELEERHRREVRNHRAVELRFGLTTMLAAYRDAIGDGDGAAAAVEALRLVNDAVEALLRAPNETLLLHALFARLPPLAARAR